MLGLIFSPTVFAVTAVLTAFMAGVALGSYLFCGLADFSRNTLLLYGLLEGESASTARPSRPSSSR
jgi:spermidine synthase